MAFLLIFAQLPGNCPDPLNPLCEVNQLITNTLATVISATQSVVSTTQSLVGGASSSLAGTTSSLPVIGGGPGETPLFQPPPPDNVRVAFDAEVPESLDRTVLNPPAAAGTPPAADPVVAEALLTSDPQRVVRARNDDDRRTLQQISDAVKGTRDLAATVERLREVPFTWVRPESRGDVVQFIDLTPDEFLQLESLTSWEFVHYVGWLSGDRPQKVAPAADGSWIDLVVWEMSSTVMAGGPATPERGSVLLGVGSMGWNNAGGFYQAAVALGDGTAAALTSEGLVVRPILELFPGYLYEQVLVGAYPWDRQPPVRSREDQIQEYQYDVLWRARR